MILYIHHARYYGCHHRILLDGSYKITRREHYDAIKLYDHGVLVTHPNLTDDSWVDIFVCDMETGEVIHEGDSGESCTEAAHLVSDPLVRAVKIANARKEPKISEGQEP